MSNNICLFFCFTTFFIFQIGLHVTGITIDQDDLTFRFKDFVTRYNRSYINNPAEYRYRMSVFEASLKRQEMLNKREKELKGKAVYGINKFSDWTEEEFVGHLSKFNNGSLLLDSDLPCCYVVEHEPSLLSWDWRKHSKVTSVKNQGNCGSCWAFAATGVVETQWAIEKNLASPLQLSVQEFVSCSGNAGCLGGSTEKTLEWLMISRYNSTGDKPEKYYLLPASEYPYEEEESPCSYGHIEPKTGAQIKCACYRDFKGKEHFLANYVRTNGSVAVGVNAVLWHDYIGGIIQHHCTDHVIDHAVIVEGFDMSGGTPYWIVRNSWGTDFGIDGYLYIKMFENICGIAEFVSFVRI
ncbi:cathepsin O-like [Dendronephthya gigantea]|uniref:cathepsin O-like n=1 Tax=Dendronephthya gigantea TaxID=151771 RepID=UPI00106D311E|nr:cathepsin O-like [Dendronephthya gigantea]XP_028397784.1 cathepsin O-like [Dendronephthya gigantea]